jgi:stage II sporulation protein D
MKPTLFQYRLRPARRDLFRFTATSRAAAVLAALFCMGALLSCGKSCSKTAGSATPALKSQPAPSATVSANEAVIRVAVEKNAASVRIGAPAGASIRTPDGRELRRIAPGAVATFSPAAAGIGVDGQQLSPGDTLLVDALDGRALSLDGNDLAPGITILRPRSNGLHAIARLGLEEYLGGVLAGEVPYQSWHPEAMKAQAITSRTFAIFQLRRNAAQPYDVESTVMSQVFKPGTRDIPKIAAAVEGTRGMVLTNDGQVFCAYFHSTCGSHTEPGQLVFPDAPAIGPLRGVPCNYCAQSPAYRWKCQLSKSALEPKLHAAFPSVSGITRFEFLNAEGRTVRQYERVCLVNVHHRGGVQQIQGNQFRLLAGPRDLKSLSFESIAERGDVIEIAGAGYGHGVGLCQWGSQGLGQAGFTSTQILGKYFPGAELTRVY